jgi:hypothetical protein
MSEPFSQPTVKLTIASKDEPGIRVPAQYNPKELQVDQTVPWKKPDAANQTGSEQGSGGKDPIALLFDGFEQNRSVAGQIAALETLARVREPENPDETKRRPHQCIVSWGGAGLPSFECVIESLSTKYTMFSPEGMPLRATCTVKLKEAHAVDKKKG